MRRVRVVLVALCCSCSGSEQVSEAEASLTEVPLAGHATQPYRIHLPEGYDTERKYPVIYAFHGASGNALSMAGTTCSSRFTALGRLPDLDATSCLHELAANYIVVYPNGRVIREGRNGVKRRGWEAGGGRYINGREYRCTTTRIGDCGTAASDDTRFFVDLHAHVTSNFAVDGRKVFLTGISNGAALTFRLACAMPEMITAIAPVAGANQFAVNMHGGVDCTASQISVGLLLIHGSADPQWRQNGDPGTLGPQRFVSPRETLSGFGRAAGWLEMNGCTDTQRDTLPNVAGEDGSPLDADHAHAARVHRGVGCRAPVQYVQVLGGGHTWPGGWQYLPAAVVGPTNRDFSANEHILRFFDSFHE